VGVFGNPLHRLAAGGAVDDARSGRLRHDPELKKAATGCRR
jgi:hypothetical protein